MKKAALMLAIIYVSAGSDVAVAGDRALGGLLLGAGGGALIGQAIGRDTEATLLGTAVGSVLGYIAGNEMERPGRGRPVVVYRRPGRHRERWVEIVPRPPRHRDEPRCRETETLAEIDGRPERVYGMACLEDGEWVAAVPTGGADFVHVRVDGDDEWRARGHAKRHGRRHHGRRARRCMVW